MNAFARLLFAIAAALAATLGDAAAFAADAYEPLELPTPPSSASFSLFLFNDLRELCEDPTLASRAPKAPALADFARRPASVSAVKQDPARAGAVLAQLLAACSAVNEALTLTPGSLLALRGFRDMTREERQLWIAQARHAQGKLDKLRGAASWELLLGDLKPDDVGTPQSPLPLGGDAAGLEERLIAGLGEFLAERAKQELTAYLAERLKAACEENVAVPSAVAGTPVTTVKVSEFVPSLCALFDSESDAGVALFALGRMLRAAAKADLERLPDYLLWRVQAGDPGASGAALAARVSFALGLELHRGAEPLRLVASLELLEKPSGCSGDCAALVPALQRIGQHTRIAEPILRVIEDGQAPGPYAFAAVALAIDKETPLPVDAMEQALNGLTDRVGRLVRVGVEIAAKHQQLLEAKTPDEKVALWRAVLVRSLELVRLEIDVSVKRPQRPAVLASVRLAELAVEGDLAGVTTQASVVLTSLGSMRVPDSARRILGLAAELASAESSEEVAQIIDAAAAPPGGYRVKYRKSAFSLTGMVGAAYYWDKSLLDADALPSTAGTDTALYLTGMVGVHGTMPAWGIHLGLYLPLLDLGTFMRATLSEETESAGNDMTGMSTGTADVENENRIGFSQVFAPGLYGTVGALGPLTAGFGVSYVPELHSVAIESSDAALPDRVTANALRYGVFLAVDVTMLAF
jgi:hypothetical protein